MADLGAAEDELLKPSEAARRLGVTPRTLIRWESQTPPAIRSSRTHGGQRRYAASEVARLKHGSEAPTDDAGLSEVTR